ncbi:TPA: phytoene/squalene synthase family protein [Candidatus Poribacteria bacterium]|nr:phytoene/squalene synthase family protein [Candidatus Poribacteria bacterium]
MDNWEIKLTNLAYSAIENAEYPQNIKIDKHILDQAYRHCNLITKKYSRTFYLASGLLPAEKRKSARALYAFCRTSDDIVDLSETNPIEKLEFWRQRALSTSIVENDPIVIAWLDTRIKYGIPTKYAEHLIDGVSRDFYQVRYNTFDELAEYCYGVASTVGLMTMHIIGFKGLKAIPYAIKMGVSLQLNNILRDVGEDWNIGRLYLPLDELRDFDLSESDIQAGIVDDRWREFMKFQINRCRQLYAEALPGIALLDPDGRFAIASAAELYRAILDDIEAHDYDVFNRRAYVSLWGKLSRLPGIWWRSKTLSY